MEAKGALWVGFGPGFNQSAVTQRTAAPNETAQTDQSREEQGKNGDEVQANPQDQQHTQPKQTQKKLGTSQTLA